MTLPGSAPPRVGIWCAVSSQAQAGEDKNSLDEQERAGRAFAEHVGGQVVALYRVAHTRDLIFYHDAERDIEAYRQLRSDVESGRFDVLWALDIDRLGRDPAIQQQVISLVEKRSSREIYLESSPHTLGQKSMGHRYLESVQGVSAAEEQQRRRRRMRTGMKGRVLKRGLLPARPPFWLDTVRDPGSGRLTHYQFNDMAPALDLITELFLAGQPYHEIRRRLDASPWPPPECARWWHRTIYTTVQSDVPAGYPSWDGHQPDQPSEHIPARWDEKTHLAVIRERARRVRSGTYRRGSSPLFHVAYCARCGATMVVHLSISRGRRYRYLCCGRHCMKSLYPEYACHANHILEERLLDELGQAFSEMTTPRAVDAFLARVGETANLPQLRSRLARAASTVADLEQRLVRAGHAYAAGDMGLDVYRQVDADLRERLEAARLLEQNTRRELDSLPDIEARRRILLELAQGFDDLVAQAEPAEISRLLQEAGLQVLVEEGHIVEIRMV